jgi:hypothetical protein
MSYTGPRQSGDFEFASVARTGIDLANRERTAEEFFDPVFQSAADLEGGRVRRLQDLCGNTGFHNLGNQVHATSYLRDSRCSSFSIVCVSTRWLLKISRATDSSLVINGSLSA